MAWFIHPPCEVAILGKEFDFLRKSLNDNYRPHVLLSGSISEGSIPLFQDKMVKGQTTIYVC